MRDSQDISTARDLSDRNDALTPAVGGARGQWRWWSLALLVAALVGAFLGVAAIGAAQAARDERVLWWFDPLIEVFRTGGSQLVLWLLAESFVLGCTITAIASVIALVGLIAAGQRAAPLVLLAATVTLCTWAQIMLFADQPSFGLCAYGFGVLCALGLGVCCSMDRLMGFPRLPMPADRGPASPANQQSVWRVHWVWEGLLILLLTLAALATRIYALTELPQGYDLEMIDSIIMSRTTWGFAEYVQTTFMSNSTGIIHLLPKKLLFDLFGTSVYGLRLSAVVFGWAATPLFYWLVRRLAGIGPAIAATVLFVAAPDQLYWSRIENANFAPIAVLGLVSAHLGLWMVERVSFWAVLATALWMPASRYFYAPGYVMFAYPLLLYGHALVCVRGAWRNAWYAVPLLLGGLTLWIFSVSILFWCFDGHWRFVHPAFIFGAPAWRMHGQPGFRDAGLVELVHLQSVAMAGKTAEVVAGFWYHDPRMFSQWFMRSYALAKHATVLNAGIAVTFALGLGYLLGQIRERRAFALLAWVGIALLPAILSDEPTTRRLTLMFPAIYAIAGVVLATTVRVVSTHTTRWLGGVTAVIISLAVTLMASTNLASHFRIATGPVLMADALRFSHPLFLQSDAIFHNLRPSVAKALLLENLDQFLQAPICYDEVGEQNWLHVALGAPCDFNGSSFRLTMPAERREKLSQAYNPRRITFLLEETPYSRPHLELLQQLYPTASVGRTKLTDGKSITSLTVDRADMRALHSPQLVVGSEESDAPALATGLLDGATLTVGGGTADYVRAGVEVMVRGGILLERDGWYRFQIGADCPAAKLTLDGREPTAEAQPMLAGVHAFEVILPSATACSLPLQLLMQGQGQANMVPVAAGLLVSPTVASVPQVQAAHVLTSRGYGDAEVLAHLAGGALDLGVDAEGQASVLLMQEGTWRVDRFDRHGQQVATWYPQLPGRQNIHGMVVDRDGTAILIADTTVLLYDRGGKEIGRWETPWAAIPLDIALAPDGAILLAVASRNAIAVFDRDGHERGEVTQIRGLPDRLLQPTGIAVSADGDMLVIQDDGRVIVSRFTSDALSPELVDTFKVDFATLPAYVRGSAFSGSDELLVPDPTTTTSLVFSAR